MSTRKSKPCACMPRLRQEESADVDAGGRTCPFLRGACHSDISEIALTSCRYGWIGPLYWPLRPCLFGGAGTDRVGLRTSAGVRTRQPATVGTALLGQARHHAVNGS